MRVYEREWESMREYDGVWWTMREYESVWEWGSMRVYDGVWGSMRAYDWVWVSEWVNEWRCVIYCNKRRHPFGICVDSQGKVGVWEKHKSQNHCMHSLVGLPFNAISQILKKQLPHSLTQRTVTVKYDPHVLNWTWNNISTEDNIFRLFLCTCISEPGPVQCVDPTLVTANGDHFKQ